MKKRLLFLGLAAGIISFKASAQLALENFNSSTLPAGWVLINDGHTVSPSFTTVTGLPAALTAAAWVPVQASATDYQMITTSYFAPAATADRWLITPPFTVTSANTVIQWDDNDLGSGEGIGVKLSPTAGTTAGAFTQTIYSALASATGDGSLTTHQVPIGSYMGSTITIAFRDSTHDNWGLVIDNVQTAILPTLDLGVTAIYMPPYVQTGSSNTIAGSLHNYGYNVVTAMNLNYSINGGTAVSTALTGLSIPLAGDYTYTSTTPWVPSTAGTYTMKVWADNINGGVDANHANDTLTTTILVIDTLQPKTVLIEEFNQASCDPCAEATPNLDSVYVNNLSTSIMVRYHVDFPGRDCMDSVTLNPFVQARLTYYNVSGVPDAQVDGQYVYPGAAGPGTFSSDILQPEAALGSPFKITVVPNFNATTKTYSYSATIKSYGAVPAGLRAFAALTIDTITYAANQSTESIPQTEFPEVAENMFPAAGTALSAFTTGSTQTVTGSWVKNHPWGSDAAVWKYDSTTTGKIVVWIEDGTNQFVYQAAYAAVNTVASTGVNAVVSNSGSMDIYPNPASRTATVALSLKTDADVKMEVYNILGQMVYSMPAEHRNSGTSLSTIDLSNFASGEYFVKTFIGDEMLTKTLTVTK